MDQEHYEFELGMAVEVRMVSTYPPNYAPHPSGQRARLADVIRNTIATITPDGWMMWPNGRQEQCPTLHLTYGQVWIKEV